MQTNAVLVTEDIAAFVRENQVKVGVSLDGDALHNRRRLDLLGRPTFERALAGYRLLQARAPDFLSGILAVIDVSNAASDTVIANVFDTMLDYDYLTRPLQLVPRTLEAMPTLFVNTNWMLPPAPPSWVTSTLS
jgi:sulfatase maturation enzyme AslB (radical SAM superfamily)